MIERQTVSFLALAKVPENICFLLTRNRVRRPFGVSLKELGGFWALINEPPPGSVKKR
jgi:hypothetical protein